MPGKESCFHAYIFPYLFIFMIGLLVYFGVVNTNEFLAILLILTIIAFVGAMSLVILGSFLYPPQHSKSRISSSKIQSDEHGKLEFTEKNLHQDELTTLIKLPHTIKKCQKMNKSEIQEELSKVEHFYISIY
jgi:hypothetical protein